MSFPPWSLSCVEKKEKGSVPSRLPGWEPGAVKEEVALSKMECPQYFYREIRENREILCSLFLLVRAVRVVRGSCFSNGVSVVILTVKYAKTAKVCEVCFSLFVPFALFAVHAFQPECPL